MGEDVFASRDLVQSGVTMRFMHLAMMAVAFCGLMLTGCSSGGEAGGTAGTGSGDSGSGEKLKIGVSIPAGTHGWTAGVVWWAEEMKKKHTDVEFTIQTAKDGAEQYSQIESMLLKALDGLVVLPMEPEPVTPAVKKAKDDGVYVVSVDRGLMEPISDVWVRGDNTKFGEVAAEYMGEKLGGQGNILVLEGMTNAVNTARVEAFNRVMAEKYPGIKILESQSGEWSREKAYEVTKTLLLKHQNVSAIWSSDDDMSIGAEQAIKEDGRTGLWMLGGGGMKDIVKRVMDGDALYPATVTYSPKMIADAIELCVAHLKEGKKPGSTQADEIIPVDVVTPDNAADFYFPDAAY